MFGKNDYCEIHFDYAVSSMNPSYNKVLDYILRCKPVPVPVPGFQPA